MFNQILAGILAAVMAFTGLFHTAFRNVADAVSEMLFGIPCTSEAIKSDFLEEIELAEITPLDENTGYVKDLILVFVEDGIRFRDRLTLLRGAGLSVAGWCVPADFYVVRCLPVDFETLMKKCAAIEKNAGVMLATPVMAGKTDTQTTPNDPFNPSDPVEWNELVPAGANWWLEAVEARQAWDYSPLFKDVTLGIVDSGFQLDHPDLAGQIRFPNDRLASRNVADDHGSHVAGIIAAKQNNGTGISGLCPHASLICVDWEPAEDTRQRWNTDLAILFGAVYAIRAGAKAVNLSLGVSASIMGEQGNQFYNEIEPRIITLFMGSLLRRGYDFLAVQSAGNGNADGLPIDASQNGQFAAIRAGNILTGLSFVSKQEILDHIIIVGAAENYNHTARQTGYSNFGDRVDIVAPGSRVYSCVNGSGYAYFSGTSMATPVVTAVVGLVWSVAPELKAAQVKEILLTSTNRIAKANPNVEGQRDLPLVNARLSVEAAVLRAHPESIRVEGDLEFKGAEAVRYHGVEYTVFSDRSFTFVATAPSGTLEALDANGNVLAEAEIEAAAGETVQVLLSQAEPDAPETPDPTEIQEEITASALDARAEAPAAA